MVPKRLFYLNPPATFPGVMECIMSTSLQPSTPHSNSTTSLTKNCPILSLKTNWMLTKTSNNNNGSGDRRCSSIFIKSMNFAQKWIKISTLCWCKTSDEAPGAVLSVRYIYICFFFADVFYFSKCLQTSNL